MATFNGEAYIQQQLQSILEQIEIDDEVVISDDLSADKTCQIIKSFNDKRITL
jgi:glycosyltransferase involved in cell wall biosynthesis